MRPEFHHWQPVALSRDIGSEPTPRTVLGVDIALFRGRSGRIGALLDVCPHRRMRLSAGWVDGDRLVCKYHGWNFAHDGTGASPAEPKRQPCAHHLDAIERHGAVWIKAPEACPRFPAVGGEAYASMAVLEHRARAPLAVVLDNFIEVEHTPTTHWLLGYERAAMAQVTTRVKVAADEVHVVNEGLQKSMPRALYALFGVRPGDLFIDEWTTYFSPVYSVYDHYWLDPATRAQRPQVLRTYVFFTPLDEHTTQVFSFVYSRSDVPWRRAVAPLLKKLVERVARHEIDLDCAAIDDLADKRADLQGMRLGRFDRPLALCRERIERIYCGGGSPL